MTRCKYWDCGWCYCETGKSNDTNGACIRPTECAQLEEDAKSEQAKQNGVNQMTEQNIRDAFELYAKNEMACSELHRYEDGYLSTFVDGMWISFKSGWVAAFKMILESENE